MRIENSGPLSGVYRSKSRAKKGSAGGGFNVEVVEKVEEATSTTPASTVGNLGALLSLQGVEEVIDDDRKKQTAEQGISLLERLEEMRVELLSGQLSVAQVDRIAQSVRTLGRTGDSALDSILEDIDMRARVELAKLGFFDI